MSEMIRLVEPLIPALRRYARTLLRDHAAADDLVQDCLERVISSWHQRRENRDTRAWVFTILHNLAVNRLRQRKRRGHEVEIGDVHDAAFAQPALQEEGLRHRDLQQALATLPDDQRSVLLLVTVEQLSCADTARVLDIPVGTVMSRLARTREKLARMMDGQMDGQNVVALPAPATSNLRRR
jgi:RNA polymerase sigma factor (sigma-70 family)